jgi:hypothetical protein
VFKKNTTTHLKRGVRSANNHEFVFKKNTTIHLKRGVRSANNHESVFENTPQLISRGELGVQIITNLRLKMFLKLL